MGCTEQPRPNWIVANGTSPWQLERNVIGIEQFGTSAGWVAGSTTGDFAVVGSYFGVDTVAPIAWVQVSRIRRVTFGMTRYWATDGIGEESFAQLADELPGSELQSLLLEVMRRARRRAHAAPTCSRSTAAIGSCAPAAIDQRTRVALDGHLLAAAERLRGDRAVAGRAARRVLDGRTDRSEPRAVGAARHRGRLRSDQRARARVRRAAARGADAPVHLATSQRVIRAQPVPEAAGLRAALPDLRARQRRPRARGPRVHGRRARAATSAPARARSIGSSSTATRSARAASTCSRRAERAALADRVAAAPSARVSASRSSTRTTRAASATCSGSPRRTATRCRSSTAARSTGSRSSPRTSATCTSRAAWARSLPRSRSARERGRATVCAVELQLDYLDSPVGELAIVADATGALRTLAFVERLTRAENWGAGARRSQIRSDSPIGCAPTSPASSLRSTRCRSRSRAPSSSAACGTRCATSRAARRARTATSRRDRPAECGPRRRARERREPDRDRVAVSPRDRLGRLAHRLRRRPARKRWLLAHESKALSFDFGHGATRSRPASIPSTRCSMPSVVAIAIAATARLAAVDRYTPAGMAATHRMDRSESARPRRAESQRETKARRAEQEQHRASPQ